MTLVSRAALAAALAAGCTAFAAAPALAQSGSYSSPAPSGAQSAEGSAQAQPAEEAPRADLSRKVRKPLMEAQELIKGADYAGATAKLDEAQAEAKTADDAYMISALKINIAIAKKDDALLEQALKGALASNSAQLTAERKTQYLQNLARLAMNRNDPAAALQIYEQVSAADPTNGEALVALGEGYNRAGDTAKGVATIRKAIAAQQAKGIEVPETWYKRALGLAYNANLRDQLTPASLMLVQAYPNASNWHDALVIFRDNNDLGDSASLDLMRLMDQAKALRGERDYAEYAQTASERGLPGEAKHILDEGIASGALSTSKPYIKEIVNVSGSKLKADKAALSGLADEARGAATGKTAAGTADAYLGYGENAKAAELYKLALQKGGVDAAEVNTRLGIALLRSGDRAGAEAAFKAVQGSGARQTLAQFWLAYLNAGASAAATVPAAPAQPADAPEPSTDG